MPFLECALLTYLGSFALASRGKHIHPEMEPSVRPCSPFHKKDKFHLDLLGGSAQDDVESVLSLFSIRKRKRSTGIKAIGTRLHFHLVVGAVSLVIDDAHNHRTRLPDHKPPGVAFGFSALAQHVELRKRLPHPRAPQHSEPEPRKQQHTDHSRSES